MATLGRAADPPLPHLPLRRATLGTEHRRPDRVLVKFMPGASSLQQTIAVQSQRTQVLRTLRGSGITTLAVPSGETPESFLKRLQPEIGRTLEWISPDKVYRAL